MAISMPVAMPIVAQIAQPIVPSVGWTPASLFAAGEPGVWYDPSDFSTMFQDNTGTTPVTATGQTVGLIFDKSQGLVLGSELVTDGDFSSSTAWTTPIAGASITGGALVFDNVTSMTGGAVVTTNTPVASIVAGKTYLVTYTIIGGTNKSVSVGVGGAAGTARIDAGTYSEYITATNTTGPYVQVRLQNGTRTGSIDNISVKELPGNHALQATLASRPLLQQDGNGYYYLLFDGSDDSLATSSFTPGTDKAQVFAGVRKLSDAATGVLLESSAAVSTNSGALQIAAPVSAGAANYSFSSKGSALGSASYTNATVTAPVTTVLTGLGDISGDSATLRTNGTQVAQATTDQGTGNYLAYPLYIGRRAGTSLPFNGRLYGLIVRFGANLDTATISSAETWVNSKTGAY